MHVIGYARTSTKAQRSSLNSQREAIQEWAEERGYRATVFADDGLSGALPVQRRPGLRDALEALRTTDASIFAVTYTDRLARDRAVTEYIHVAVDAASARLVVLNEHVEFTLAADLMSGTLDAHDRFVRQCATERIAALRHLTPASIAKRLNREGVLRPRVSWTAEAVRRMLDPSDYKSPSPAWSSNSAAERT